MGRPGRAAVGPHLQLLAARHSSPDRGQAGGCQGRKEQPNKGPRDGRDTSSTSGRQGKPLGLSDEPFRPLDGRPSQQLLVSWSPGQARGQTDSKNTCCRWQLLTTHWEGSYSVVRPPSAPPRVRLARAHPSIVVEDFPLFPLPSPLALAELSRRFPTLQSHPSSSTVT